MTLSRVHTVVDCRERVRHVRGSPRFGAVHKFVDNHVDWVVEGGRARYASLWVTGSSPIHPRNVFFSLIC